MKIIDLLNKIANGEEVPKEIIYKGKAYYVEFNSCSGKSYYCDDEDNLLLESIDSVFQLNDEIEEDKKIEKLETYKEIDDDEHYANILKVSKNGEYEITEDMSVVIDKINELIDKINKKER